MSSEKKKLCTLNIYETEIEQIPGGKSRIIPGDLTYIFPYYYDGNRIEYISWGKENYNIYFKSAEVGEFCYIYQDGEWKGPQEWDISSTIDLLDLQKQ